MSEKPYNVVFTGKYHPTVDLETVKSNLILGLNMPEDKVLRLLSRKGEVLLKRCATVGEAQLLVEKFDTAGAICLIREAGASMEAANNGESSLVRLLKSFSGAGSKDGSKSIMARMGSTFNRK